MSNATSVPVSHISTVHGAATRRSPGLETPVQAAVVARESRAQAIRVEDPPLREGTPSPADANPVLLTLLSSGESYHDARDRVIAQFERQYLSWLVIRAGGNMTKAARIAGVDRTTLYRLMERHGLRRSPRAGWVVERVAHDAPDRGADAAEGQVAETAEPLSPVSIELP